MSFVKTVLSALLVLLAINTATAFAANDCEAVDGLCNQSQVPVTLAEIYQHADGKGDNSYLKAAEAYYKLVNAYAAMAVAADARSVAESDLTLAEEKFADGESNSFAVTSSKTTMLALEAALLQATKLWVMASADVSFFLKEKPEALYIPGDVNFDNVPAYTLPALKPDIDLTRFDELEKRAQKEHRNVAGYELEHALVLGHTDWHFNNALLEKATTALTLAQTNRRQMQVSFESGLSSEHDLNNAELLFKKAQAQYLKAAGASDLSRLRLLEGTGTLNDAVKGWLKQQENKI